MILQLLMTSSHPHFRLRQLRVYNGSCDIHPDFQGSITQCYAPYKYYFEDTNDFLPAYRYLQILYIKQVLLRDLNQVNKVLLLDFT